LTGELSTSFTGLSEGIFLGFFPKQSIGRINEILWFSILIFLPEAAPSFSISGLPSEIHGERN